MSSTEKIMEKIVEIINSIIEKENITIEQADADLAALGMDSLKFISIVVAMEEAFQIEIPDEKLLVTEMGTLNEMIDVVSTALGFADE